MYQGSIVEPKIYDDLDDNILVLIGGENKHFPFSIEKILNQIRFIESNNEFTNKKILIFNSRITPEKLNTVLKDWSKQSNNLNFMDYQKSVSLSNYMGKSSYTFVTPDSVNMIFESGNNRLIKGRQTVWNGNLSIKILAFLSLLLLFFKVSK